MPPLYKNDVRLNDSRSVLRLMQRVLNGLLRDKDDKGSIPVDRARALIYGCSVMIKGFEVTDLEERLEKMEAILNEQK
jgi:hypothetical protein